MSTGITRAPQLPLGAGAAAAVAKTGLAASLRDTEDLRAHPAKGDEEGGEGEAAVGTKRQREETAEVRGEGRGKCPRERGEGPKARRQTCKGEVWQQAKTVKMRGQVKEI